ncbi:MAG: hypothetical protein NUV54_01410 [Candidatus Taylorbacteria bacterium]|nr:hypothetical protein [Candidatus Taylorbacteria bacterium]
MKLFYQSLVSFKKVSIALSAIFPGVTFGATSLQTPSNLTEFVNNFTVILNVLLPVIAGFGFFGFITGVLKYANAGGDEERLSKAKQLIAYGLVGMFIMFTFWALAKIVANSYFLVGA